MSTLMLVTVLLLQWPGYSHITPRAGEPSPVQGQISVTVVLVDRPIPPMLLRRATYQPSNVVLVSSESADPRTLSEAVAVLVMLDSMDPLGRQRENQNAIRVNQSVRENAEPWAAPAIARLRAANQRNIEGIGFHRAIDIRVPTRPGFGETVRTYRRNP
jgi:hypothetical protein